jgi:integrase/recombinase XerD
MPANRPTSETSIVVFGEHAALLWHWLLEVLPVSIRTGQLTESTHRSYTNVIRAWLALLGSEGRPTPRHVTSWVIAMHESGKAAATISSYLAGLKSAYRWTETEDLYVNIARAAKSPRVSKDTPLPCPTTDQVRTMFQTVPTTSLRGLRDRALVAILYSTALRTISICRAQVQDLDLAAGTIRHQPKGHREKDAVAVLSVSAREAMRDYFAARGPVRSDMPLFVSAGNRRNDQAGLSSRSIRAVILDLAEAQGLVQRTPEGKVRDRGHYSAHSIRRAAITTIAERFGLDSARNLAGHASVDTTRRAYARVNSYRQHQLAAEALDF